MTTEISMPSGIRLVSTNGNGAGALQSATKIYEALLDAGAAPWVEVLIHSVAPAGPAPAVDPHEAAGAPEPADPPAMPAAHDWDWSLLPDPALRGTVLELDQGTAVWRHLECAQRRQLLTFVAANLLRQNGALTVRDWDGHKPAWAPAQPSLSITYQITLRELIDQARLLITRATSSTG